MPTVRTNEIDTYYEKAGEGPPIIFIHGAIMDLNMWLPQIERLSDEYTVIAYDVRGHGRTGGSGKKPYSIELYADDLDALINSLDIEKPVLCGLSMGGLIAQVYASKYTDKVGGLVLAGTFTPEITSISGRLQMFMLRRTILPVRLTSTTLISLRTVSERYSRRYIPPSATLKKI